MCRWVVVSFIVLMVAVSAKADVLSKRVEYRCEGEPCVGVLYFDNAMSARRPGVLVADEAGSTRPITREHAAQIAKLGYVVFTVDLFGDRDGQHEPKDAAARMALAGLNQPDHKLMRARADAAMKTLLKQSGVDSKQIAAVGYGIGGTAMIELARTGVDLEGVVCLHGPVTAANAEDKEQIQPTFLILEGAEDPAAPADELKTFEADMKRAKAQCTLARFAGVGHAFDEATEKKCDEAIRLYLADEIPIKTARKPAAKAVVARASDFPASVTEVLKYVDEHGEPMEGYEGGRTFGNYEHRLAATDRSGKRIKYREWDVNEHRPGVNRGVERLITGSDDSAWYTDDHYETFKQVR